MLPWARYDLLRFGRLGCREMALGWRSAERGPKVRGPGQLLRVRRNAWFAPNRNGDLLLVRSSTHIRPQANGRNRPVKSGFVCAHLGPTGFGVGQFAVGCLSSRETHRSRDQEQKSERATRSERGDKVSADKPEPRIKMMPRQVKLEASGQVAASKGQVAKVVKVRRTRQARNPQLSVARRNERERNRVKMVNNGFALLREHLPVEDLQACEGSGSDTPTPDNGSQSGHKSSGSKAKKFSKVETLRAAIQRIKMLEQLIRSTEPSFESMNIVSSSQFAGYEEAEPPLSVCEPPSCGSSHSNSMSAPIQSQGLEFQQQQQQQHQHQQQPAYCQQEQYVAKPEMQQHNAANLPSPQSSQASGLNLNAYSPITKVHPNQQQERLSESSPAHSLASSQMDEQSHTHLWIQQHQSSFMEQQQYQQQQSTNWYQEQQQQLELGSSQRATDWFSQQQQQQQRQAQSESPEEAASSQLAHLQHQPSSVQSQMESAPIWFSGGASDSPVSAQAGPQPSPFAHHHHRHHHHQQHQISLYSQ